MKKYLLTIFAGILLGLVISGLLIVVINKLGKKENIQSQEINQPNSAVESNQQNVSEEITEEAPVDKIQEPAVPENTNLNTEENKIKVPENSENKFKFAIIGDTQYFKIENKAGAFQKAVARIKEQSVDLIVSDGDIVSSCDDNCVEKIANWKNILGSLTGKTYVAMGNHDRTGGNKSDKIFQDSFAFPTNGPSGYSELVYSFDFKNSHFIFLDSEKPEENLINADQRNWLEKDLATTKKENKFIFFHEPAYPLSDKIDESLDANAKDRDALWDILKKYNVTAVFNGHEHLQSRRNVGGILQFIFGNTDSFNHELPKSGADFSYKGQAFGIVEVDGKNIKVKTISVDGKLLNEFAFSK